MTSDEIMEKETKKKKKKTWFGIEFKIEIS